MPNDENRRRQLRESQRRVRAGAAPLRVPSECGSTAAARKHRRHGEKVCDACKAAEAAASRARAKPSGRPPGRPKQSSPAQGTE